MADTKITALAAISTIDAAVDPLAIVDVSDTSMAASGTTKKVTSQQILGSGGNASVGTLNASGAATLSSTLAVTGTSTFTGAMTANGNLTANANTTLGNAQTDIITINGQLQAREGELASSIRAAASNYAGVVFDGATLSTRVTSTLTGQNIGTGDFSLWSRFRVPELGLLGNNPGLIGIGPNSSDNGGNNSFRVGLLSTGSLYLRANDGSGVTTNGDITGFVSAYTGQVVDLVITRTGSTLKVYINGTDTAYTGALSASNSITSSYCSIGIGSSSSAVFNGLIYRSVLFNRALSSADVSDLIETGVNPADQWGTQTQLMNATTENGGFETAGAGGADVFANWLETTSGTSTVNRDTSVFYAGAASCRFDLDASGSAVNLTSSNINYVRAKRFRVSCYARGTATSARVGVNVGEASFQPLGAVLDNSSWQYRSLEFICGSGGSTPAAINRYVGSNTGSIWIDNVIVERIGAIVDLDFTVGIGYQAFDSSTNKLDGTLFNGVSWTQPTRMGFARGTLTANAGQQLLGTLAIPTDAHIDYVVVENVSAGSSATFSMGTAPGTLTNILNAQPLGGNGTKTTFDPVDGFSSTGNLWCAWSAAGTVKVTVAYRQVL